jgi:thiol:disulfide interchange protein
MTPLRCFWSALLLSISAAVAGAESEPEPSGIQWRSWSDGLLEEAKDEGRFVLLDLTASWCAFCKKMKQVTYRDEAVEAVVREHYIAVRISDETNPVLAARYADYGRPASVVLDADGQELIRRRGYMEPRLMTWMLQAVAQNPDPEAHR